MSMRDQIRAIQTPPELIAHAHTKKVRKILPDRFSDFGSILAEREAIRTLRLLPVKTEKSRKEYNKIKHSLVRSVDAILGKELIAVAKNQFPYFLPHDVHQEIVWIRDGVDDETILDYLAGYLWDSNLDELIMFERPRTVDVPLIRGSFKAVRHIHLWRKLK